MLRQLKWCAENLLHKCRLCSYPFLLLTGRMPGIQKAPPIQTRAHLEPTGPQLHRERESVCPWQKKLCLHIPRQRNPWEMQGTGGISPRTKFSASVHASLLQKDCVLCEKVVPEQTVGEKPCPSKKSEISGLECLSSLLVLRDLSSDTW